MVLVEYGGNCNRLGVWEKVAGWFSILIANIFIRDNYLQHTNFLTLNDKESVLVSPVIHVYTLRKKIERQSSQDFLDSTWIG